MKYLLIGPEGLPVLPVPFDTEAEALAYLPQFVARFKQQGYFTTADGWRIPLKEIANACHVEAMEWDEEETTP